MDRPFLDANVLFSAAYQAKDEPIFLAALLAQATHLLTGDLKHFGHYFGQTVAGSGR